MSWKVAALKLQLQEIHPSCTHFELTDDGIEIHFIDGNPMEAGEFVWGSPTRESLDELEDLLRGDNHE